MADKILEYKGHPLVRNGNDLIFYGSTSDKCIAVLQIKETSTIPDKGGNGQELRIATKVAVQLQLNDPNLKPRDRILRRTERPKDSLWEAMDLASTWLEMELAK